MENGKTELLKKSRRTWHQFQVYIAYVGLGPRFKMAIPKNQIKHVGNYSSHTTIPSETKV